MTPNPQLTVGAGRVVALYYSVKDSAGNEIDSHSRHGHKPLVILFGSGNIVTGLEKLIEGKRKDDFVTGVVEPEDAYGPHDPAKVEVVQRAAISLEEELQPGMVLTGPDQRGQPKSALVVAVEGDQITLDSNHPMAGQSLAFEVTIAGVREATPEEIQHGHPHGPGGHKH